MGDWEGRWSKPHPYSGHGIIEIMMPLLQIMNKSWALLRLWINAAQPISVELPLC